MSDLTGTGANYSAGCRCDECRAARRDRHRRLRAERRAQRREVDGRLIAPGAPHGTATAYCDWYCRCRPCTTAAARALARRRAARAAAA